MAVQLAPERDFRGPGCTDVCEVVRAIVPGRFGRSELLLHDPASHEEYGRAAGSSRDGSVVVWTGALVIDRWSRTVTSDGERVHLTAREWQILDYLAAYIGRCCSSAEIEEAIWNKDMWSPDGHLIRVNIARLRRKLGANRRLIQNDFGIGYRLVIEEAVECGR